jgi:hypothetical protein
MHDTKNFFIAYISSVFPLYAAAEHTDLIPIVSAIVLPAVFFMIGKSVDVLVQIYLHRRAERVADSQPADSKPPWTQ